MPSGRKSSIHLLTEGGLATSLLCVCSPCLSLLIALMFGRSSCLIYGILQVCCVLAGYKLFSLPQTTVCHGKVLGQREWLPAQLQNIYKGMKWSHA